VQGDTSVQPRLERRLTERLQRKKRLLDTFRPLRSGIVRRLHEDLRIRLTYHSNAIEGNTLSLRETQIVVEEGITVGGHSLKEHLEAVNHANAYDFMSGLATGDAPLTIETILQLHTLVLTNIDPSAGKFREVPVYIRGSNLELPHARQVPSLIAQWCAWLRGDGLQYEPVTRAALAHHGFVAVHPFEDGNGRTGRLLLNLMLMREGYPPAFVLRNWAERYRNALSAADHGRYSPIVNVIGQAVEEGLDFYLRACNARPDEQYQPLPQLARAAGRDPNYLSLLARQGKLEVVRRGSRLYSTQEALDVYFQQAQEGKKRSGRPRKQKQE
jgi:cell filamentation protein, protein adenylyltransferase